MRRPTSRRIALAVLVENGGFGAQAAAPIARAGASTTTCSGKMPTPARAGGPGARRRRRRERLMDDIDPRAGVGSADAPDRQLPLRRSRWRSSASDSSRSSRRPTRASRACRARRRASRFALVLMWIVANMPPQTLARAAVPLYVAGRRAAGRASRCSAPWSTARAAGSTSAFARFQPSELMKIALPLMLAWYFQKFEGRIGWKDFVLAGGPDRRCPCS